MSPCVTSSLAQVVQKCFAAATNLFLTRTDSNSHRERFFHSFHKGPFIGTDIGSICDHYLTNSSSLLRLFWCQTICFYFVVLVEKSKKRWKKCGFILISGCQRGYSSFTHVRLSVCLQSWRRRHMSYLYLHRGYCLVQCFLFWLKINWNVLK